MSVDFCGGTAHQISLAKKLTVNNVSTAEESKTNTKKGTGNQLCIGVAHFVESLICICLGNSVAFATMLTIG